MAFGTPASAAGKAKKREIGGRKLETTITKEAVEKALERIRPALRMDGGDVELVEIDGKVVRLKMTGACHGCPMSILTLQMGIEAALKDAIPEIERVEAVDMDFDSTDLFAE
jgi:Fe-S cluster biogenesis protein NfuA